MTCLLWFPLLLALVGLNFWEEIGALGIFPAGGAFGIVPSDGTDGHGGNEADDVDGDEISRKFACSGGRFQK